MYVYMYQPSVLYIKHTCCTAEMLLTVGIVIGFRDMPPYVTNVPSSLQESIIDVHIITLQKYIQYENQPQTSQQICSTLTPYTVQCKPRSTIFLH